MRVEGNEMVTSVRWSRRGWQRIALVALAAALLSVGACNQVQEEKAIGRVTLAITQVPNDVSCLRLTAQGMSLTTVQIVDLMPGASSVMTEVGGLPLGTVTISAEAFATCPPTTNTAPTWISDPVTVSITSGVVAAIPLQMRQAGRGSLSVDFVNCTASGGACTTSSACCGGLMCSGGVCTGGMCTANGGACAMASTCCSGICSGGVCASTTCSNAGQACTGGQACCAGLMCVSGVCAAPTTTTTIDAAADAYVRDGTANQNLNFGAVASLPVKTTGTIGNNRVAYFRFPLSGLTGTVTAAKLRLFGSRPVASALPDGAYAVTDNSWGESTITWVNKPALGAAQGSGVVVGTAAGYYEWNVASFVTQQKNASVASVSLAVHMDTTMPNDAAPDAFNSREATANRPQLVVTTTP